MANTLQARKRARQADKRRQLNASQRSALRTAIKKVEAAVEAGDHDAALATYREQMPVVDRLTDKDIIHKNKAARHKSRLHKRIKALQPA